MECCTLIMKITCLYDFVMQTEQVVLMIEKALPEDVPSWEIILYLGSARSKTMCHSQRSRMNILQQEAAALN